jgi:hypothetical protein
MCGHPQVKDTSTVQHRPDNDAAMDDVPEACGVAQSKGLTGIESALRNASLDVCKEALPTLRASDDKPDDGIHEHHRDVHMSNHGSITTISCGGVRANLIQILQNVPDKPMRNRMLTGRVI